MFNVGDKVKCIELPGVNESKGSKLDLITTYEITEVDTNKEGEQTINLVVYSSKVKMAWWQSKRFVLV